MISLADILDFYKFMEERRKKKNLEKNIFTLNIGFENKIVMSDDDYNQLMGDLLLRQRECNDAHLKIDFIGLDKFTKKLSLLKNKKKLTNEELIERDKMSQAFTNALRPYQKLEGIFKFYFSEIHSVATRCSYIHEPNHLGSIIKGLVEVIDQQSVLITPQNYTDYNRVYISRYIPENLSSSTWLTKVEYNQVLEKFSHDEITMTKFNTGSMDVMDLPSEIIRRRILPAITTTLFTKIKHDKSKSENLKENLQLCDWNIRHD